MCRFIVGSYVVYIGLYDYFADKKNNDMVDRLLEELSIEEEPVQEGEKPFEGLTFGKERNTGEKI